MLLIRLVSRIQPTKFCVGAALVGVQKSETLPTGYLLDRQRTKSEKLQPDQDIEMTDLLLVKQDSERNIRR